MKHSFFGMVLFGILTQLGFILLVLNLQTLHVINLGIDLFQTCSILRMLLAPQVQVC